MSAFRLLTGRAGSGKTARAMAGIAEAVARREKGQLLLVPEQYSHEAEKELCRVCGDSLSLYGEVLSFTRLAAHVADELGTHRPTLDKGGRLLAMKVALSALGGRLRVYSAAQRRPELMGALLQGLSELKSAALTPQALSEAAALEGGALGDKLEDLSLLLAAYDAVTAQGKADPDDKLTLLAENLHRSAVGETGRICIDGFSDFTAQEMRVIEALMDKGADLTVCLSCDALEGGSEIYDAARKTALKLLAMARARGMTPEVVHLDPVRGDDAPALEFLQEHLFSYTSAYCEDKEDAISLFTAPDEMSECALAAWRCLQLVREKGCRWRDISVVVRGFEHYADKLESVFAHYGVPLYISRRSSILKKPLPHMLQAAFEVISGGWDCEAVLDWLKTGLCGASARELDELENYALQWNLRGSVWTRDAAWTLSVEGFSAAETEANAQKLASLDALRKKLVSPLHRYALAAEQAHTAAEHARIFADFLQDMQLAETLSARAESLLARGLAAEAAEYSQLWEILVDALEQFAAVLDAMPMDREEFGGLLIAMLSQYDVGSIPASLDTVTAGDMDRMRRRHLKHLIVLGAADERLPAPEKQEILLTAEERERMGELGLELSCPRTDGLYRELSLIHSCLTLPSETLTMSYPTLGGESRPSVIFTRLGLLTGKTAQPYSRERVMACAAAPAMELAAERSGAASQAAWKYFAQNEESAARLEKLRAAREISRGRLSEKSVRALYGETPRISATRAENFAQCGYAYFLKYGLKAKPRQRAEFDPPEMGKFMHFVLENVTREVQESGGFASLDDERRDALVNKYVAQYIHDVLHDFRDKSGRFIYLFRRLTTAVRRVVADMAAELAASDFVPLDFELDLGNMGVALTDGENSVAVTGIADRVDGWLHEGKLYLRVVDYKTGKKAFSLSDVWYGMGLQMLMYLFALEKSGAAHYGEKIVPAGVLYTPARDVLVRAKHDISDAEIIAARGKQLRRSGLLLGEETVLRAMEKGEEPRYIPVKFNAEGKALGDSLASREQLGALARHIEKTLLELARELRSGQIDASPAYRSSQDNACQWCDYREICRFDESCDKRRWQTKLQSQEVWTRLQADGKEAEA